jgi:hypothetical protein
MRRTSGHQSGIRILLLGAVLLSSYRIFAQRGAGGGLVGGGTGGGSGLSGHTGIATGIDTKDDLKDFHDVVAVQASPQQAAAYKLMLKTTEAASAKLQAFSQAASKTNASADLQQLNKPLVEDIENARSSNAKFLEQLSEKQKTGLKESVKRLAKTDSDLEQQTKILNAEGANPTTQQFTAAQNLDQALSLFYNQQLGLGEEMSIGTAGSQDVTYKILPVRTAINFANQTVSITTSGTVFKPPITDSNTFLVQLTSDLSDLQQSLTDVLRAVLNKSDSCGEQIAVQSAVLTASTPASVVLADLHYERWTCFGRGVANEIAEGNGSIEIRLSPLVADDGTLRLTAAIGRVDAPGLLGDLLRSQSLGETVRDKIASVLLAAIRQSSDYKTLLPRSAQGNVALQKAEFQGSGAGKLSIVLEGGIKVSGDQLTSLISELKAGETKTQLSPAESTSR